MIVLLAVLFIGIVVVAVVSIGVMLGKYKPYGIASLSALVGGIYAWIVNATTNFTEYILEPAFESGRAWDLYRIGAVVMTIGLIAVGLVAFFNAISTWSRDEPISLWK